MVRKSNNVIQISVTHTLVMTATSCCHMDTKSATTQLVHEISPRLLHQVGVLGVGRLNCISEVCVRPSPVAMVIKICKFSHQIQHNSAHRRFTIGQQFLHQTRGFGVGQANSHSKFLTDPLLLSWQPVTVIWTPNRQ